MHVILLLWSTLWYYIHKIYLLNNLEDSSQEAALVSSFDIPWPTVKVVTVRDFRNKNSAWAAFYSREFTLKFCQNIWTKF